MSLRRLIRSFLFDDLRQSGVMVDIASIGSLPVDEELAQRNAERARAVIQQMGSRWCLYNKRTKGAV